MWQLPFTIAKTLKIKIDIDEGQACKPEKGSFFPRQALEILISFSFGQQLLKMTKALLCNLEKAKKNVPCL